MRYLVLLLLLAPAVWAKEYTITVKCQDGQSGLACAVTSVEVSGPVYPFTVSTAAELATALSNVAAGQTILLKDGNYGDLTITKQWPDYIELLAENKHGAVFGKVVASGPTRGGIRFNGVRATGYDLRAGAHHFELVNSLVEGGLYFKDAADIVVRNTAVRADIALHASRVNSVKRAVFEHNVFTNAQEDLMAITGDSEDVRVVKNSFYNTKPKQLPDCEYNHTDAIQFFGANGLNPRKVLVEGNLFFDDPADNEVRTGCGDGRITMQGVFLSDPDGEGYSDITIRNNLFYVGSSNTIAINGAYRNVLVENNTLIGWGNGGGTIRVTERTTARNVGLIIRNNLARSFVATNTVYKVVSGENYIYLGSDAQRLFSFDTLANTWQSFLPRTTELPETMGATAELRKIQAGLALPPGLLE